MSEGREHVDVALVTAVFDGDADGSRLKDALSDARGRGATVAVLPELPLNPWSPATREARDDDAEPPEGPRHRRMADAAAAVGISLVGGDIVTDPKTRALHHPALVFGHDGAWLVFGPDGACRSRYRKVHLPEEEGYWETSHYVPGDRPPEIVEIAGMKAGLQICSDVNRPTFFQLLAAQGADVVFAPRATPTETYARWRLILRAEAVMSGCWVVSTNRPGPVPGVDMGGASLAIAPDGTVVAETTEPVHVARLELEAVDEARREYPGYLERFPALYEEGWRRVRGRG
jgi:N-carbamoylputrescine amidase